MFKKSSLVQRGASLDKLRPISDILGDNAGILYLDKSGSNTHRMGQIKNFLRSLRDKM